MNTSTEAGVAKWFFLGLLLLAIVAVVLVLAPVFTPLVLAVVVAIIFYPLHTFVCRYVSYSWLAALVSVLAVVTFFLIPLGIFGFLLFQELSEVYAATFNNNQIGPLATLIRTIEDLLITVQGFLPGQIDLAEAINVRSVVGQAQSWVLQNVSGIFTGLVTYLFALFLFLIALYYFFKDGQFFVKQILKISPLDDRHDMKVMEKVVLAVNSVVRGHLIVGLIQGTLSGVGFAIFGAPSPIIWGFIAAIASLVPNLGTGLVNVPIIIYLAISVGWLQALGLAIWAIVVVGLVDNLIGPKLIERGVHIHPLVILLSALGGIAVLGPIGFIAGPVLVAILIVLVELYPVILLQKPETKIAVPQSEIDSK